MIFKKRKTSKTRKFVIKTSDYGIVLLLNFIKYSITTIKEDISSTTDIDLLKDLISEKYVLMDIAHQLGITIYDEEIKAKKSLPLEIKDTLKRNKENESNINSSESLLGPHKEQEIINEGTEIINADDEVF